MRRRSRSSGWKTLVDGVVVLALVGALAACDDREKTAAEKETDKRAAALVADLQADQELVKGDVGRVEVELESRLRKAVVMQNGLMIIHNPADAGTDMHVLPLSTPWMLNCGLVGIRAVFGSSVTGDNSSVQNDVEVVLTPAGVDQAVCDVLAPKLAHVLQQAQ